MWKPKLRWPHLGFITLHYLYIVGLGVLTFVILYPAGNLSSTDAYFFGASASTESGLNVEDVNNLYLYQQIALYFIPILGNMQVVSIFIVIFRYFWFRQRLKSKAAGIKHYRENLQLSRDATKVDTAALPRAQSWTVTTKDDQKVGVDLSHESMGLDPGDAPSKPSRPLPVDLTDKETLKSKDDLYQSTYPVQHEQGETTERFGNLQAASTHIRFAPEMRPVRQQVLTDHSLAQSGLYPYELDEKRGRDYDPDHEDPKMGITRTRSSEAHEASIRFRNNRASSRSWDRDRSPGRTTLQRVVTNVFELGGIDHIPPMQRRAQTEDMGLGRTSSRESSSSRRAQRRASKIEKLKLSTNVVLGRNSNFSNLTSDDKDRLGGVEYQSLKLLVKVVVCYYVSLHLIGIICLTPWIFLTQEPKYRQYLTDKGINYTWWSIYSAGTMANNLGFTLTPDSMISFRDAVFPILIMTLLAYAGHTFYPICLRVVIWSMSKLYPADHKLQEPLRFLLNHPRRCYILLFPRRQTWILAGVLIGLNVIDVILIICLDLDNPEVTALPIAPRFISSIFQSASSRHTGTSTFNLANVSPGVQFSLLVMMYIKSALGVYEDEEVDPATTTNSKSYFMAHVRNQLSFDLWYIFLGTFCICCAESDRIMNPAEPTFQIFPIFFEVASAYANVGLSLGYPTTSTSFSGVLGQFSKLVICAMMLRGRHRGLPVRLDRAILLPSEKFSVQDVEALAAESKTTISNRLPRLKQTHTQ